MLLKNKFIFLFWFYIFGISTLFLTTATFFSSFYLISVNSLENEYVELQDIPSECIYEDISTTCKCQTNKELRKTRGRIQKAVHYIKVAFSKLLLFVLYSLAIFLVFYSLNLFRNEGLRPVHYLADCRQCHGFIYSLYHIAGFDNPSY